MNATFFEISNENNFSNIDDKELGSLFLKYKNVKLKVMTLAKITPPDHTPSLIGFRSYRINSWNFYSI